MASHIKTRLMDEDLLALGDVNAEVIDGEIVIANPTTIDHTIYGSVIGTYLNVFVGVHDLGWVGGDMAAFKLEEYPEGGIKGARVPDVFYVSYERLPRDASLSIIPAFSPDLAVEVISESEPHTEVLKKTNDYLDHGVHVVWHLIPALREIHSFTPVHRSGTILTDKDRLDGGDLLPGFSIPVRAVFDVTDASLHAETLRSLMDTAP